MTVGAHLPHIVWSLLQPSIGAFVSPALDLAHPILTMPRLIVAKILSLTGPT
jgi:hypothetical protein